MENEKIIKGKIIIVEYHRQLSVYKVTCATVISDYNLTHLWPTLRSNLSNKESDTIPVSLSLNGKKIFNDNLECGYFLTYWIFFFFFCGLCSSPFLYTHTHTQMHKVCLWVYMGRGVLNSGRSVYV